MVRAVLPLTLLLTFSVPAFAANPDCDRFQVGDPDDYLKATFNQAMSNAIGCEQSNFSTEKPQVLSLGFLLDLPGGEQSQILSADYVARTLDHSRVRDGEEAYLFSGYDARRLDEKKLEAEIAQRKLSPESATNVRALFKTAQERNAKMVAFLTNEKSADYNYKQIFIDIPEAGAVAWQKFYQEHKDVYDLGTSIERTFSSTDRSKRGFQTVEVKGCDDMHQALKGYLASQKGKLPPEISQFLLADQLGFEMLSSLAVCDGLRGFKMDAAGEYSLIAPGRMWRGPRNAAYWAALASAMDTQGKTNAASPIHEGGASINDHKLMRLAKEIFETNFTIDRDPDSGKVAAVKKLGDGWLEVTFKVEKWMEPDMECVDVKPLHFNHWGAQGQPVWDWTCHVKSYHEMKKELPPHAFSEAASAGIKPGMLIKMNTGGQQKDPKVQAFPLEVSIPAKTKKDKPKLVSFSGIAL